jgi:alpha-mannosidase
MTDKKTLHLVPQFHYDIEYLLPLEAYLEPVFENLLEAHRLLSRHEDYTYLIEQAFLLEQFMREYPDRFADFRKFAAEGRLDISSGMYAMADQNMPSGESLVRQLVVGKAWCEGHLGASPTVFNAGDCTGACAQFPQLIRHCGYDTFVFMRAVDEPDRKAEILWKGIDGTEVFAYWMSAGYGGWIPPIYTAIPPGDEIPCNLEDAAETVCAHALSDAALLPHGGDFVHPSERTPGDVAAWNAAHPDQPIIFSTYTRAMAAMDWSRAVPYEGEWNPDRSGAYSSRIGIKQANRRCEGLLRTAETLGLMARLQLGAPIDHDGLLRAWKLTFVSQFHDAIWGTVCDDAYKRIMVRARRVYNITERIIESRLQNILDTHVGDASGRNLIAYNPLPWPRIEDIALPAKGPAVGMDMAADAGFEYGRTVRVELPASGYRIVRIEEEAQSRETPFTATPEEGGGFSIETPLYSGAVSASGVISRLARKSDGLEFVDPKRPWFNALCMESDRGDLWQYHEGPVSDGGPRGKGSEITPAPYPLDINLTRNGARRLGWAYDNRTTPVDGVSIVENSADRLVICAKGKFNPLWPYFRRESATEKDLRFDIRMTFFADTPRIDFHVVTDHRMGRWYRLRAAFFTDIVDGAIHHEIPFGRCERPEGEFAAQNYMAVCDENKGLALLNRGLPGNNVTDGVAMIALMRSVDLGGRTESSLAFEEGQQHVFDYAILPFGGSKELDSLALARRGAEFAAPPYVYERDPRRLPDPVDGEIAEAGGLFTLAPDNIVCTACYECEQGIVVRLYESEGREAEGSLNLSFDVAAASETDAMLRNGTPLSVVSGGVALRFRPLEMKTILLNTRS